MNSGYTKLVHLFRKHAQITYFFEGHSLKDELDYFHLSILLEAGINRELNLTDISKSLSVDLSKVSRAVSLLVNLNYLQVTTRTKDRRIKNLTLTSKGQATLEEFDKLGHLTFARLSRNLNQFELVRYNSYWGRFADGAGARKIQLRPTEHPFLLQQRRLTRAHNLMSDTYLGSGVSFLQFQVLSEINYANKLITAKDLIATFGVNKSTLSVLLKHFSDKGFIIQSKGSIDQREKTLKLSEKGKKFFISLEGKISKVFAEQLKLKPEELEEFTSIMSRYLGLNNTNSVNLKVELQPSVKITQPETDTERKEARSFLVFNLVRSNRYLDVPENLISKEKLVYSLLVNEKLSAITQFAIKADEFICETWAVDDSTLTLDFLLTYLEYIKKNLAEKDPNKIINLDSSLLGLSQII